MDEGDGIGFSRASVNASLERMRERQEAMVQVFRVLALLGLAYVELTGMLETPRPSLTGPGLVVSLALVGVAVGGMLPIAWAGRSPALPSALLLTVLAISSGALYWLQPHGVGILGSFVAAGAAALRLPRRQSAIVGAVALLGILAPALFVGDRSIDGVLLDCAGIVAFFVMGELAHRLGAGQELASRLLAELEESQQARAEAAVIAERQRVARDMHDVLAHSLSGLVLQLEAARLLARNRSADPEVVAAVERALHLGKAGLDEARRAIGMLRGDELPGPDALATLATDFERDSDIETTLHVEGPARPLDSSTGLTVYRVAQEALTNVRKHARAERVDLWLTYEPDGTRLRVEDVARDGASNARTGEGTVGGGYGITGMRERAELLGGRLDACSTPTGFRVELWVPR